MRTTYSYLADENSTLLVECGNCPWRGEERETLAIADLAKRILPGEVVPVGECPECGCLCRYVSPAERSGSPFAAEGRPHG